MFNCTTSLSSSLQNKLLLALIAVVSSLATTAVGQEKIIHVSMYSSSFSWFQNATESTVTSVEPPPLDVVIFGSNEYICSPAGFGQHSRCYGR